MGAQPHVLDHTVKGDDLLPFTFVVRSHRIEARTIII